MKVYGIATKALKTYGHGDFGEELMIATTGAYGGESFPPLFTTREAAQIYLDSLEWRHNMEVVELNLIGDLSAD